MIAGKNGMFDQGNLGNRPIFWVAGLDAGGGQGAQNIGSIQKEVKPEIETGTFTNGDAWARVKPGTGELIIQRGYYGVASGDQGVGASGVAQTDYLGKRVYVTQAAASGLTAHEAGHVHASVVLYNKTAALAVAAAATYRNAVLAGAPGESEAQVKSRLETLINWDARVSRFKDRDTAVNSNNGEFHAWETQQGGGVAHVQAGPVTINGTIYDYVVKSRSEYPMDQNDLNYQLPNYGSYDPAG